MIETAQPAPPRSSRAGNRWSAPPSAALRSGPAWLPGSPGIGVGAAIGRASRTPNRSPRGTGLPTPQSHPRSVVWSAGDAACPFPRPSGARKLPPTRPESHPPQPLLPRSPPSRFPFAATAAASPPDLTRGHRTPRPALRLPPVNGDGERKEPSAYARSEPAEPATNEKGSSDRLANRRGAARPGGAASRTVALTTAHSSHPW